MLEFIDKLEHKRIHRIGPFVPLKEDELRREKSNKPTSQNSNAPPKNPPPDLKINVPIGNKPIVQNQQPKQPPIVSNNGKTIQERIEKLEKDKYKDDEDDFLCCLKGPLNDIIVSKLFIG